MKCLLRYQWVKLPRVSLPQGKGVMGYWTKLASKVAFRKGKASYCGHVNDVEAGVWSGGIVGLKSILGIKNRQKALEIMDALSKLGYLECTLDSKTKKLTYKITDWVVECSGADCTDGGTVYATDGYGFFCLPRNITERLAEQRYIFEEADAWLDLWCHTVWQEPNNAFSHLAPTLQYGKYGAVLTLETLGKRWNWEKTKVWRFLQKHADAFTLHKLPGSYGCIIFNTLYPAGVEYIAPSPEKIMSILDVIRILSENAHLQGTDNDRLNRMVARYSKHLPKQDTPTLSDENRVAVFTHITRAYFSHCKNYRNCNNYDCKKNVKKYPDKKNHLIRGPCICPT